MENNVWDILEKKIQYNENHIKNIESLHDTIVKIIEIVPQEDIRKLLDGMNYFSYEAFALMEYYHLNKIS